VGETGKAVESREVAGVDEGETDDKVRIDIGERIRAESDEMNAAKCAVCPDDRFA